MKNLDIQKYIKEAEEIEKLYLTLLDKTEDESGICKINKDAKQIQREINRRYKIWFECCGRIVAKFLYESDIEVFINQYQMIIQYISLPNIGSIRDMEYHCSRENLESNFINTFDIQVNILHTITPVIEIEKTNFKKLITADLLDSELSQAELLYKHDFTRAAGSIAGVVLERFLKTLCEVNEIPINEKDTIDPLATKLYKSNKLPDFDKTLFKSMQHLASIRNKCSHPKEEPKKQEVRELLDKVKKITFLGL